MLDDTIRAKIDTIRSQHEFFTFLVMKNGDIRCGVVQNETSKLIVFYDFDKIKDEEARERFINFADEWWWGSNQSIPIDSFIGDDFDEFRPALCGYPKKSLELDPIGPTFSIQDLYIKRIKKKRVDLVNRV